MTNSNYYQYTIQPGDTLWSLANEYGLTVDEIIDANPEIDPDNLMVGQVIIIPAPQMMNNEQLRWGPWGGPWGGGPWGGGPWGGGPWGGPWGRAWGWRRGWW
jgi:hypothetical protein